MVRTTGSSPQATRSQAKNLPSSKPIRFFFPRKVRNMQRDQKGAIFIAVLYLMLVCMQTNRISLLKIETITIHPTSLTPNWADESLWISHPHPFTPFHSALANSFKSRWLFFFFFGRGEWRVAERHLEMTRHLCYKIIRDYYNRDFIATSSSVF